MEHLKDGIRTEVKLEIYFYFQKLIHYVPEGFGYSAMCQLHDEVIKRQIQFQNVVGGVSDVITLLTSVLVKAQLESCLQLGAPHFQRVSKS